jgi:hypothetical protein
MGISSIILLHHSREFSTDPFLVSRGRGKMGKDMEIVREMKMEMGREMEMKEIKMGTEMEMRGDKMGREMEIVKKLELGREMEMRGDKDGYGNGDERR